MMEYVWIVERTDVRIPIYLVNEHNGDLYLTFDVWEATQFYDELSAKYEIVRLSLNSGDKGVWKSAEHGFESVNDK